MMKQITTSRLVAATALAGFLAATPALAQDATQTQTPPAATTGDSIAPDGMTTTERFITMQAPDDWVASRVIGSTVYSASDEDLGSVEDIVADNDGQVKAIVIGVGGFLGIGQKNVAVAPTTLERVADGDSWKYRLNTTKEELTAAPEFVRADQAPARVDDGTTSSTVPADPATPVAPTDPMVPADPMAPAPATPAPATPATP